MNLVHWTLALTLIALAPLAAAQEASPTERALEVRFTDADCGSDMTDCLVWTGDDVSVVGYGDQVVLTVHNDASTAVNVVVYLDVMGWGSGGTVEEPVGPEETQESQADSETDPGADASGDEPARDAGRLDALAPGTSGTISFTVPDHTGTLSLVFDDGARELARHDVAYYMTLETGHPDAPVQYDSTGNEDPAATGSIDDGTDDLDNVADGADGADGAGTQAEDEDASGLGLVLLVTGLLVAVAARRRS
ncbi:MAG: hypothetical protein ACPGQL_11205 [Thermoplasmatota archaeon]